MVPVRCPVGSGFATLGRKRLIHSRYLIVRQTGIPQPTSPRRIPCETSLFHTCGRTDRRAFPPPGCTAKAVLTLPLLLRRPPPRCRRGFTLLELLVVLVLLGLAVALVLPSLRVPDRAHAQSSVLERARATAVRRGESVRLFMSRDGAWTVRATSDTTGEILLAGTGVESSGPDLAQSIVISALGTCLPEGASAFGATAWDPARCATARR